MGVASEFTALCPRKLAVTVPSYLYDLQDHPDHSILESRGQSESQKSELFSFKTQIANILSIHLLLIELDPLNTAECGRKKQSIAAQSCPSCNSITILGGKSGSWCTAARYIIYLGF